MDLERNSRTTAIGLARYAKEYIDAALVVDIEMGKGDEYAFVSPIPAYFLLVHGIELTFKSYLRHEGLTVEQLEKRALGHDLAALHAKANDLGLKAFFALTASDVEAFKMLIELNENHQLRYIQTGWKRFPSWAIASPLAIRLHQAVAALMGAKSFTMSIGS